MPVAPRPTATSSAMSATSVIRSGTRGARAGRARAGGGSAGEAGAADGAWCSAASPLLSSPALVAVLTTSGSARQAQGVAHPADGVQQPGLGGVDLAAQVGDVGLDDVRLPVEVVVPHVVEDLRLRQHP